MKLALAQDDDGVSGHQFLRYDDKYFNENWDRAKSSYKHIKIVKSDDSTRPYAILETASLNELVKFEDQFSIIRVEENEHNTQVPYTLVML